MKLNKKTAKRIKKLNQDIIEAHSRYCGTDEYLDPMFIDDFTDEQLDAYYKSGMEQIELDMLTVNLSAKIAAQILLGYNIARRGKKLHPTTINKKITKLPWTHMAAVQNMRRTNVRPNGSCGFSRVLFDELKKYGILLLDETYYEKLQDRLKCEYRVLNTYPTAITARTAMRNIKNIENKLKLFNKSVVTSHEQIKQKVREAFLERPF